MVHLSRSILLVVLSLQYFVVTEAFKLQYASPTLTTTSIRTDLACKFHDKLVNCNSPGNKQKHRRFSQLYMSSENANTATISEETSDASTAIILPSPPDVPFTLDAMIKQTASAMRNAAKDGVTRQIVRILLPRDKSNADIGRYFERYDPDDFNSNNNNIVLCPTDESWQGGIMQLYRSAAPTVQQIIRLVSNDVAGVPLRITEDRSIDESGVDGVGLISTSDQSIVCYVQPTQEIVDEYVTKAQRSPATSVVALINPQWRQVNDALDEASVSNTNSFLSNFASFLGGKGNTLKQIQQVGYKPIYTLEGYVCRGTNIRLLQMGHDNTNYHVYVERDDVDKTFLYVGTNVNGRPTYQQVDTMLQNANIGYKYARDIGLQPKL